MPQRDSCPVQIDAGGRKRTAVSVVFDHNPPRHLNHAHDTPRRVCVAYVSRSNAHRQAETKTPPAKAGGCLVWRRISGSDDRARDRLLPRRTCRQSPSRWCSITDIGALIVIRLSESPTPDQKRPRCRTPLTVLHRTRFPPSLIGGMRCPCRVGCGVAGALRHAHSARTPAEVQILFALRYTLYATVPSN